MEGPYRTAHPARQARSQRTLETILGAVEGLLGERTFEEVSVADIAERSGCAVGTVYKRLPNKQALLDCLLERHAAHSRALIAEFLASPERAGEDLQARVGALVAYVVHAYRARRGILRALSTRFYGPRGADAGAEAYREALGGPVDSLVEHLAARVPGPRALERARFALLTLTAVCLNRIVFTGSTGLRIDLTDRALERELTVMLLGYLS